MSQNNIWYLPGPFHQYVEDVKALAKEKGLRIIDANATTSRDGEANKTPEVTVRQAPVVLVVGDVGNVDLDALRAELAAVGLVLDQAATGNLVRPEEGKDAQRLYELLNGVAGTVRDLEQSRQVLIEQGAELRDQVGSLEQSNRDLLAKNSDLQSQLEVIELKQKLDAAGVQYRANASKENLQKLVDELPKG